MVENLKQRFRQSGVALPLEKHAGTVYRLQPYPYPYPYPYSYPYSYPYPYPYP